MKSEYIIPVMLIIVLVSALLERKKVYDLFCDGARDGIKIIIEMFPTLIGIFVAIGMLRGSGLLDFISNLISNFTVNFGIPSEIIPLAVIRPISGSASVAISTDLMKIYGPDSRIGMIAASIMGSSETTFYVIAIYMNAINAKDSRKVLIPAILADLASVITAILILK